MTISAETARALHQSQKRFRNADELLAAGGADETIKVAAQEYLEARIKHQEAIGAAEDEMRVAEDQS